MSLGAYLLTAFAGALLIPGLPLLFPLRPRRPSKMAQPDTGPYRSAPPRCGECGQIRVRR